jgi:autotransporter-associated beta strand protein
MRRGFCTRAALFGVGLAFAFAQRAAAQSLDIPLQLSESSGGVRLIINVGIGGQGALPYLFDTGSSGFVAAYSASAFGSVPSNMSAATQQYPNGLPTGVSISYSSNNTYVGNFVAVPSLTFYPTASTPVGSSSSVTLNALNSSGAASNFIIDAAYSRDGAPISVPLQSTPNVFKGIYGIFGVGDFAFSIPGNSANTQPGVTPNTTTATIGGVLGQAVVPGTTAGYVVAANGQALSSLYTGSGTVPGATVNGPQVGVGQNVTSCNPCVTLGLTPALIAQFRPMNTMPWIALGSGPLGNGTMVPAFPNSNAYAGLEFGVNLNYSVTTPVLGTKQYNNQPTLLDTGTPTYQFASNLIPFSFTAQSGTVTMSGTATGATTITNQIVPRGSFPYLVPYQADFTSLTPPSPPNPPTAENTIGIGFFLQNSVLFNLAGQAIGYTSNFVTDANFATTSMAPLTIGASSVPLGLAGIISGPGGVFVTPGGSVTLSGTNTYTGLTSVTGGYLALVGPGSIATSSGVNVSGGGIFDISGTDNGASIRSLAGDQNGLVWLGSQTLIITAAQDVFAGTIGGSGGLTLAGGIERLTGTNLYTGPTTINGGVLQVDGVIAGTSGVTVNATGALAGNGIVDPLTVTINSRGTLAPGTPGGFGALTIEGTLLFNAGSFYAINVAPGAGNNSKTAVVGSAALGGNGTVVMMPQLGHYDGAVYQILTTTAGLNGTFAGLTVNGTFVGSATLDYASHPGNIDLNVSGASLLTTPPGANQNQQNVISGINKGILNSPANASLPAQFLTLGALSGPSLLGAMTQLDGEADTGAERAALQLTNQFLTLMLDPFVNGRGGVGSGSAAIGFAPGQQASLPPDIALAYASILTKAPPSHPSPVGGGGPGWETFEQRWTAWGSAFGGSNTTSGDGAAGSSTTTASTYGFAAGMDYHVSPYTVVGFALAGAGTNWSLANASGSGRSDAMQIGGYGISWFGPAYLAGALSFTNHWFTTGRSALGDQLSANFVGQSYGVRVEGGYRYPVLPALGVTPYGAVQFQDFNTPTYSESDATGGGLGLSYAAMNATDVRSELGARTDGLTVVYGKPLIVFGRLAWAHDFVSNSSLSAAFEALPGGSFTVNGAAIPHDSALTSAGTQLFLTPQWTLLAKFDGEFAKGSQTYAGTGTLRYTW